MLGVYSSQAATERFTVKSISLIISRLLADIGEDAAIDIQDMAVHEIRRVRRKEDSRSHEIFRSAPAGSGSLRDNKLVKRMAASVRLTLP